MLYTKIIDGSTITVEWLKETSKVFTAALYNGYDKSPQAVDYDTPDYYTLRSLKDNLLAFSAAKDFSQLKEMSSMLLDNNGKLRSFESFRDAVQGINDKYNVNWLRTEYDTALGSAQMARVWNDVQSNDTFGDLTVVTAGDERVRSLHQSYEGFTRPKKDPIWLTFCPPFDWYCRCIVSESNAPASGQIDLSEIPTLFQNNPGASGFIFDSDHPYFDKFKNSTSAIAYPVAATIDNLTFKNYNLEEWMSAKADRPEAIESSDFESWWRTFVVSRTSPVIDSALLKDLFGEKFILPKKVAGQSNYYKLIETTGLVPDEVWLRSNSLRSYLLQFSNGVLHLQVNKKGVVISCELLTYKQANKERKGIPMN